MKNIYRIIKKGLFLLPVFMWFYLPETMKAGDGLRSSVTSSVLNTGDWYRLAVSETGIYRLNYTDLEAMGLDMNALDPRHLRIYGNGAGMLEESNSLPRKDDLMENAIFISGEEDGKFDPQDYVLFYGESPVVIKHNPFYLQYEHENNFYTEKTYYFLSTGPGPGKRVEQGAVAPGEPTHEVYHCEELVYHEKDELNLIKSGKVWVGEAFNTETSQDFMFNLLHAELSEPVVLKASLVGKSTTNTEINLYINGEFLEELDVPNVVLGSSIYARPVISNYESFYVDNPEVKVTIEFNKPGANDIAWLNYIELNYLRKLVFDGGQLNFRNIQPVGPENIARYHLQSATQAVSIWDVTDPEDIISIPVNGQGGSVTFTRTADKLREYIVFDQLAFLTPEFVEPVVNQDLHSLSPVEYLVITHPLFLEQAHRLADHHRQHDGMTAHVVTTQQIYNEFSSGAQDISAIRVFVKMLYDRGEGTFTSRYLLLFGDASYDYLGRIEPNHNFVPAYQTRESLKAAASFVTDDFFGCLDEDEGSNASGTVDIGIGRLPVHTLEQAEAMVDKIIRYATNAAENHGPWRNKICFVADDEDNNIHLNQAEGLVEIADSMAAVYNFSKIYLDAYEQMQTPSGTRYPDAFNAIVNSVDAGSLIINYTGHGGETGWAGERVLDIPAIQAFRNMDNMPAFVTATCEFSRYDDPSLVSAGELVFLNPDGGGIGLFTTTRLAYSQSNYALNKRFYDAAFITDSVTGEYPRMGDLIRLSKTPSNQNIKNFVLLGDPGLMLAYPTMKVRTLEIINENSGRPADTIQALSTVTITGQVEDLSGNRMENFSGFLYPTVFDKPVVYNTRGNDPTSKVTDFYIQDKILFEGRFTVDSGFFSFTFIVPRDISYQYGLGKISYYAVDTNSYLDAHGYDPVLIGGSDSLSEPDTEGPQIELFLNSLEFISGDLTTSDPLLIARLFDKSGINTVGNGIGHEIVAIVDDNYQMPIVLNDYFTPETDSYQRGQVLYRLGPFENGTHTITLKAWDVFNNSSEATISFQVNTGARLALSNVSSYPNPFKTGGAYFTFHHNRPGAAFQVQVRIINLLGQQVAGVEYEFVSETLESVPYHWDGLDYNGDELIPGLYVYHLIVQTDDGYVSEATQKLIRVR